jgi:Phosphotransferase enzyme family
MSRHRELERPIRSATETAAAFGIFHDRCDILQDGHTLVLRLTDSLVARIVTDFDGPRQGSAWFTRESAVACHLANNGAPVIPMHSQIPAGPHEHLGYTLNFWQFVTRIDEKPAPQEIGKTLAQCHAVLRSYDGQLEELGIIHETLQLLVQTTPKQWLSAENISLLKRCLHSSLIGLQNTPMQPLHGDAHEGNLMNTTEGLLWTDWEDTFLGPIEWDLASILWNTLYLENDNASATTILDAYRREGTTASEEILKICLIARAAVMCAWYPLLYPNPSAERQEKLRFRLEWLKQSIH